MITSSATVKAVLTNVKCLERHERSGAINRALDGYLAGAASRLKSVFAAYRMVAAILFDSAPTDRNHYWY